MASCGALGRLFLTLAVVYLAYVLFGAFTVKVPADGWRPAGFDPAKVKAAKLVTAENVSARERRQDQAVLAGLDFAVLQRHRGIDIPEQAKPMIQVFFRKSDGGSLVSAAVAAGFVGLISIGNMAGWSATSDVTGSKRIYMVYLGVGAMLCTVLALAGSATTVLYVALAFVRISFYGGGFETVPAYLRDLFGTFQVGAIHGRLVTAWSVAGVAGPLIVSLSHQRQIRNLVYGNHDLPTRTPSDKHHGSDVAYKRSCASTIHAVPSHAYP